MTKTAKFHGKTYEVKNTGKTYRNPAKSYTDFNGYDVDKPAGSRKGLGMYDEHGEKAFNVTANGQVLNSDNKIIGGVKIKDS